MAARQCMPALASGGHTVATRCSNATGQQAGRLTLQCGGVRAQRRRRQRLVLLMLAGGLAPSALGNDLSGGLGVRVVVNVVPACQCTKPATVSARAVLHWKRAEAAAAVAGAAEGSHSPPIAPAVGGHGHLYSRLFLLGAPAERLALRGARGRRRGGPLACLGGVRRRHEAVSRT